MTNCESLTGRLREICQGIADIPLERINAYRAKWGMLPLSEDDRPQSIVVSQRRQSQRLPSAPRPRLNGWGPGSQLMIAYRKSGLPHCDACHMLACKMDDWGPEECELRIDEIVSDIVPRAKSWIESNRPWIHKLLPGIIEDAAIIYKLRSDVRIAIENSRDLKRNGSRAATSSSARVTVVKSGSSGQRAKSPCVGCGSSSVKSIRAASHVKKRSNARELSRVKEPVKYPPVERVSFNDSIKRNFMMHLWPVSGYRAWQWNCDQVLKRADLFNGRRIIAIATSRDADSPSDVMEYMKGFTDEFIVAPNSRALREVVTFTKLLERLKSNNRNEVTFSCHGKCVRHKASVDDDNTIFRWTRVMYETCLDHWPLVESQLRSSAMTGSFKRYGQFATKGNHRWHYSGTFYWFRNADVYNRRWRKIDQKFFGTESWPGLMFKPDETACLFLDKCEDLYKKSYWDSVVDQQLELWNRLNARS